MMNYNTAYHSLSKQILKNNIARGKQPSRLLLTNRDQRKQNRNALKSKNNTTVHDRLHGSNTRKISELVMKMEQQKQEQFSKNYR